MTPAESGTTPHDPPGRDAPATPKLCSVPIGFPISIALGLGAIGLSTLAIRKPSLELDEVVAETFSVIEWSQVGVWIVTALLAAVAVARQRSGRLLLISAWFGVVSLFAGMRELDLHVVLNPANIHMLGLDESQAVRFRLDWWTDESVPIGLKAVWAVVLGTAALLVIAPIALARFPWIRRFFRRDPFAWLVATGFGLLAASYVIDDFLGRPLARVGIGVGLVEELGELAGQCFLVVAVGLLAMRKITPGVTPDRLLRPTDQAAGSGGR